MQVLFIHQGFPGQFGQLVNYITRKSSTHQVRCFGMREPTTSLPKSWNFTRYSPKYASNNNIHALAREYEAKTIRAEACMHKAYELKKHGYQPDLIYAHPGWGEALLIKEIWPHSPLLTYQEFYYHTRNSDIDFDPEFYDRDVTLKNTARARLKNAHILAGLNDSSWCISPTLFQKELVPRVLRDKVSVIHDGINSTACKPSKRAQALLILGNEINIVPNKPLITFANRSLEPYRGYHTFVRAIPGIQAQCPEAQIVITGATAGVSYGSPCPEEGMEWKDYFLREIEGQYDPSRVHFTGQLPYEPFIALLQRSDCHVYLTYPFVLSWSLLEAMSCGCPVVGSATAPVQEVIEHGRNGLLVDFFKPADLAEAVAELLHNPERARELGAAARQTILERYELQSCLKQQMALIELVASGALSAR